MSAWDLKKATSTARVDPGPSASRDLPTVSVVVPAYNSTDSLGWVLLGLTGQSFPERNMEVIIADDGSDDTYEQFTSRSWPWPLSVVRQLRQGFRLASARNLGVKHASGDVVIFLDSDCVPTRGFVLAHARWCGSARGAPVAVFGPRRYLARPDKGHNWGIERVRELESAADIRSSANFGLARDRRAQEVVRLKTHPAAYHLWHGCNASTRRDILIAVGGFSESFNGHWGYEDTELAYRLATRGTAFVADPAAEVLHLESVGETYDRVVDDLVNFEKACEMIPAFRSFKDELRVRGRAPWW